MKSVGEAMAIGRTFQDSLQKAFRSLETGLNGINEIEIEGIGQGDDKNAVCAALAMPTPDRLLVVAQALRLGTSRKEIHDICKIDPWFIEQIDGLVSMEARVREHGLPEDAFNRTVMGDPAVVERLQFMAPMSDDTRNQYLELWQEVKTYFAE